jgi:membrane-associated protease RseP (regulator of RpoE activity)
MKTMTKMMVTVLAMGLSATAAQASQEPAPKAKAAPKVAPATPATPAAPAAKAYAMAWSSSGGSYLGVDISEVTSDRVGPLKLKEERGVEITMVDRDAPAGKAGLKEHDVILEFNGTRVEGEEQLRRMLRETPAGRKITLGISRDGQPMQIEATLAARESSMARVAPRVWKMEPPDIPNIDVQVPAIEMVVRSYSRRTGMMVDNLTPQLGEFFGGKSGQGVLVRSVEKGSAAEAAGLKAGDVITKVDNESIDDRNDWNRIMRKKGGKVAIGIVRDKREQTLTVTLPEVKSSEEGRFFEFDGDAGFEFQPQAVDMERLQRSLRKFRELDSKRFAERQAVMHKALAQMNVRLAGQLAQMHLKMENAMKEHRKAFEKDRERIRIKVEEKLRDAEKI